MMFKHQFFQRAMKHWAFIHCRNQAIAQVFTESLDQFGKEAAASVIWDLYMVNIREAEEFPPSERWCGRKISSSLNRLYKSGWFWLIISLGFLYLAY